MSAESDTKKSREESFREYCHGVVEVMAAFLGLQLSEGEVKVWLDRFVEYPEWKLSILLKDYSLDDRGGGRTLAHVCKYLDTMRPAPEVYEAPKMLPEPKSNIGKYTIAHVLKMISSIDGPLTQDRLKEKRRIEREGLEAMHKKYPWAGFDNILRHEKRFQEEVVDYKKAAAGEK